MPLLERDVQDTQLKSLFSGAAGGCGACVLVSGEPGVGKTSLVRAFTQSLPAPADVLWGGCEALFTPRPLGPIVDMADDLPPGLAARIHEGHAYHALFPALLGCLRQRGRPVVVVIEDVHWADKPTLDWIKYAGRRIERAPILLVLTLREDELALDHPLRQVVGDLPAASTHRIRLQPLTGASIEQLAQARGRDAAQVARLTGGNPFYVMELLAGDPGELPGSIRDAVLARLGGLGEAARRIVQLVAIEPGRLELEVVDACEPDADAAVVEAIERRMLRTDAHGLAFHHEIARLIVEASLPASTRVRLHARLLDALQVQPGARASLARLVHHARAAGRQAEVARIAPRAAEEAARDGSHRDAASLYRIASEASASSAPAVRAALLEAGANELQMTGALADAIHSREQALSLRRHLGDARREGDNLRMLGVLRWQSGGSEADYERCARAAVEILEPFGETGEFAKACAALSHVHYLRSEYDTAIDWGERAVRIAERAQDPSARILALNRLGSARICRSYDLRSRALVEEALALAIECRFEEQAAEIHLSLLTHALNYHDHGFALDVAARGVDFCTARDLDTYVAEIRERRAHSLVHLGRWDDAMREFESCLAQPNLPPQLRSALHYARFRQAVRCGGGPGPAAPPSLSDACVDDYWRDAQSRIRQMRIGFRVPAIAAACAEAAWLRRDLPAALEAAHLGLEDALRAHDDRLAGPLLVWIQRCGQAPPRYEGNLPSACARELGRDVAGAAHVWQRLNAPYERALTLAFGDAGQAREALVALESLGARRAASAVRARLHAKGERGLAIGPRRRTRADSDGLTPRERQIFSLLVEGLSNETIGRRLHRSERTVEHHVSSVLAKLGVKTRAELIARRVREA